MRSFFFFIIKLFFRKDEKIMAVVYATLIVKGKKTLDQVPARLKAEVQEILEALEITI